MPVTRKATIEVKLLPFRQALAAVYPHRSKVKTGDDEAMYRVRLVFSAEWLFVMATNGSTAGLAKVRIITDTRKPVLGKLDPDDGPMIVDLQPRRVPLLQQQFKPNKAESAANQLLNIDISIDPEDPVIDFTDVGGLFSAGESQRYPLEQPAEQFPDVIDLVGKALARAGESDKSKDLVSDPALLALFATAGKAYDSQVRIRSVGTPDARGFLVTVGSDFLGTIESKHNDDGGTKARDSAVLDWMNIIGLKKLKAV
jgi:hypothetical protein